MIEFIFTIDYEILGNGTGALNELVYEPARRLKELFDEHHAKFVAFVEIAEFEKIEDYGTDSSIENVKKQIAGFHRDGFEVGLHLHPQWSNARYENREWHLDLSEYNLCTLPRPRITEIIDHSLAYLHHVVGASDFEPVSFRAGNWLFQPTEIAASVLSEKGIKIDSSVFKGGLQRSHQLDYRPSLSNGYYWRFSKDVNCVDSSGLLIEVPIHTEMVRPWRMATSKRMAFNNRYGATHQSIWQKLVRRMDFVRPWYPQKLDFCRMTIDEMVSMMERVIEHDRQNPELYKPIIAIGHTKDLGEFGPVGAFLDFLKARKIKISIFSEIAPRLSAGNNN
jgi:hypothetical protein